MKIWLKYFLLLPGILVLASFITNPAYSQQKPQKSKLQQDISNESAKKQQQQKQQQINKIDKELNKNSQWRQKYGGKDSASDAKLNQRTRDLNDQKKSLQGQSQKQPTNRGGAAQAQNDRETQRDKGIGGTFHREGRYQGEAARQR